MSHSEAHGRPAGSPHPVTPSRPSKPLSTFGVLRAAARNSLSFCDDELFEEPIVARRYWLQNVMFVSDPAGVKHVLLDRFDNYPRWTNSRRLFERELKTGTLSSEGETWRRHRRVSTPVIDARSVSADLPMLVELAERKADELHAAARRGKTINLQKWLGKLSAEMLNQVVSGGDPDCIEVLEWFARVPHKPRTIDLVPKPKWMSDLLARPRDPQSVLANARLDTLIEARRRPDYAGPRDLIWRTVHGIDRSSNAPLSPAEGRDEAANLITGGIATVRAMTWIWYLLALHPEVEARVHAEIDVVTGGKPIDPGDIQQLRYTRQTLDEAMRLYPPIPAILREAAADDVICGQPAKAGTFVVVMPWIIHRHKLLWDEPGRFDPDRFEPGKAAQRSRYAYIPFAVGPRVCVAAAFATTQLMVAISVLARRFRFRLAPGYEVMPAGAVSLRVDGGLYVTVERRT